MQPVEPALMPCSRCKGTGVDGTAAVEAQHGKEVAEGCVLCGGERFMTAERLRWLQKYAAEYHNLRGERLGCAVCLFAVIGGLLRWFSANDSWGGVVALFAFGLGVVLSFIATNDAREHWLSQNPEPAPSQVIYWRTKRRNSG
jgi:hypothetical protein